MRHLVPGSHTSLSCVFPAPVPSRCLVCAIGYAMPHKSARKILACDSPECGREHATRPNAATTIESMSHTRSGLAQNVMTVLTACWGWIPDPMDVRGRGVCSHQIHALRRSEKHKVLSPAPQRGRGALVAQPQTLAQPPELSAGIVIEHVMARQSLSKTRASGRSSTAYIAYIYIYIYVCIYTIIWGSQIV